jgi:ribonucleoside-diphosphate reductase alpha chain
MEYPFPRLEVTAKARRSIGVGITNLAYAMAKAGLRYSDIEGKRYIARLAERHSYCLHKAALRLAEERGCCEWTDRTKYSRGWLPIDTANREIQAIIGQPLLCDWEGLRKRMLDVGGLRFSVLEAHMPCESSSVAGGHTNGLYPIRAYKVVKTSGTNKNLFIAPELDTLASSYELAWEIPTNDMIDVYAIVQCFTGQAISADLYIKYDKEGKRELSAKTMLQEWLRRVKLGMKTKYYTNSSTGVELDASPKEEEAPVCDSCSL